MQRRGFLSLLGSAAASPLVPLRSALAGPVSGYSRKLFGLGVLNALTQPGITAREMAQQLGLSPEQSNAMHAELLSKGIVSSDADAAFSALRTNKATPTSDTEIQTAPKAQETTMEKFTKLTGTAAPMPLVNIDTDMIIPKVFLKTIKRSGLGVNLFDEMRYDRQGNEIPDFVLNKPQYRDAKILVAGDNFGCGSSREHAPWAIADFGIRCVISTSFADIFYNNCFKNGILPIVLPQEDVDKLMEDAERGANATVTVDLENQTIEGPDGGQISFDVDPFKKRCLLEGLDDIGLTMEKASAIDAFEAKASAARPWA